MVVAGTILAATNQEMEDAMNDITSRVRTTEDVPAGFPPGIEMAWGVIANATDWDRDDRVEWRAAAERWRDEYLLGR